MNEETPKPFQHTAGGGIPQPEFIPKFYKQKTKKRKSPWLSMGGK